MLQLQEALLSFPSVLFELLEKCSVAPDPAVASHSYFKEAASRYSGTPDLILELVINLLRNAFTVSLKLCGSWCRSTLAAVSRVGKFRK